MHCRYCKINRNFALRNRMNSCINNPLCNQLVTTCSTVFLEKLVVVHLVRIFLAFYGTKVFTTAFTRARHLLYSEAHKSRPKPPAIFTSNAFQYLSFPSVFRSSKRSLPFRLFSHNAVYVPYRTNTYCMPSPSFM